MVYLVYGTVSRKGRVIISVRRRLAPLKQFSVDAGQDVVG